MTGQGFTEQISLFLMEEHLNFWMSLRLQAGPGGQILEEMDPGMFQDQKTRLHVMQMTVCWMEKWHS